MQDTINAYHINYCNTNEMGTASSFVDNRTIHNMLTWIHIVKILHLRTMLKDGVVVPAISEMGVSTGRFMYRLGFGFSAWMFVCVCVCLRFVEDMVW